MYFERSCARVHLPISRERNGTFLVKVFIRFLVKVSNFSAASDTYVYLCIIYHNVSRAVYVYFCYRKASVARKKKRSMRLPFFLANSCAFERQDFVTVAKIEQLQSWICKVAKSAKFHYIVIAQLRILADRMIYFNIRENLQWKLANFFHAIPYISIITCIKNNKELLGRLIVCE